MTLPTLATLSSGKASAASSGLHLWCVCRPFHGKKVVSSSWKQPSIWGLGWWPGCQLYSKQAPFFPWGEAVARRVLSLNRGPFPTDLLPNPFLWNRISLNCQVAKTGLSCRSLASAPECWEWGHVPPGWPSWHCFLLAALAGSSVPCLCGAV